jgi:hypothetical protein
MMLRIRREFTYALLTRLSRTELTLVQIRHCGYPVGTCPYRIYPLLLYQHR